MIRETPSDDLQRLVERIEGATGDDPDLLWEAQRIVNPEPPTIWKNEQREVWTPEYAAYIACGHRFGELIDAGAYLDAAMALVANEWESVSIRRTDDGLWHVELAHNDGHMMAEDPEEWWVMSEDRPSPALALCAAALRARITQEQINDPSSNG